MKLINSVINLKNFFFQDKATKLLLVLLLLAFIGAVLKFFGGDKFITLYSFFSIIIFIFAVLKIKTKTEDEYTDEEIKKGWENSKP